MLAEKNAKKLRKLQTPEEKILWERIKNRRLGNYKFRRQAIIDLLIVDFCCFEKRLVIELDGFGHRKNKPIDMNRDRYLKSQGFRIIRLWNSEIDQNLEKTINKILVALESPSSGAVAPPSPVKGEGQNGI